jgi:DNA-3-methyladenine glycosylase I
MRFPLITIAASSSLNALSRRRRTALRHYVGVVSTKGARFTSRMSSTGHDEGEVAVTKEQHNRKKPRHNFVSSERSVITRDNLCDDWFQQFVQNDPLYLDYMTKEWGHEEHYQNDNQLFEKLSLEGAQAGLSWRTILYKREAYRKAYQNFDIDKVASMSNSDVDKLLSAQSVNSNELVVRHRGKLESVIHNAKIIQSLKTEGTIPSLKEYLWSFVNHKPILNSWKSFKDIPSKSAESEAMSKELKKRGFKFVGPTTMYAFLQSCGFVIDHPVGSRGWLDAEKRLKMREGGYQRR